MFVQRFGANKQEDKNNADLFVYCGKWSSLKYLDVEKVCEPVPSVTALTPFLAVTSTKCFW